MKDQSLRFVFLPGSGGGRPDLSFLTAGSSIIFEQIDYPDWQRYVADDFSPTALIAELAAEINIRVPEGPIRLVGLSMGGHFGYAVALHLQGMGREIAGLCAIDSFMIDTAEPTDGWLKRAFREGIELLRAKQIDKFNEFIRSRFWRAVLRVIGDRLHEFCHAGWLPRLAKMDWILKRELRMRLLVRAVAPWLATLDQEPAVLNVPATLLRTGLNFGDDEAWRRRCPEIQFYQLTGAHHTLLEPENRAKFRDAFMAGTRDWCNSAAYSTSKP